MSAVNNDISRFHRERTEHRGQEAYPRIAGSRDKEFEGKRGSSSREANCGTGMNTRVPLSTTSGAQALGDLPLPRDHEGRASKRSTPSITLDDLLREEMQ